MKTSAENVSYKKITCALWPDPRHFWNMGKPGWQKVDLSSLSVVHTKLIKMSHFVVDSHWSSFIVLSDIWIVVWEVPCGHSEVMNECKHSRLKCEGDKGEEVIFAGENEMSVSFYSAFLTSYVNNPEMSETSVESGRREKKGDGSKSNWVHGGSLVMC